MLIIRLSILAVLVKLNHNDLLKKTCQLFDLMALTVLIVILRYLEGFYSSIELNKVCSETAVIYTLPLILSASYCLPFVRSNIGSGDILFLFAIAPLAPGIKAFLLLFVACVLALPLAFLQYSMNKYKYKNNNSAYSFAFIPFLTLAFLIINIHL